MSLEEKIEGLIAALEKNTAAVLGQASATAVTGAAAPAKTTRTKTPPKKEEPKDDLDLDGLGDDTTADDDLGLDDDEPAAKAIDKETLKEAFKALTKKAGGRESVADILKSFKSTSFNDLKESDFAAAYDKVQKALK